MQWRDRATESTTKIDFIDVNIKRTYFGQSFCHLESTHCVHIGSHDRYALIRSFRISECNVPEQIDLKYMFILYDVINIYKYIKTGVSQLCNFKLLLWTTLGDNIVLRYINARLCWLWRFQRIVHRYILYFCSILATLV